MRLMTIGAILQNRRVLPKERTTPLRVATVAILIHRALDQLFGIGRAVWIVTTSASNLALAEGHVRRERWSWARCIWWHRRQVRVGWLLWS